MRIGILIVTTILLGLSLNFANGQSSDSTELKVSRWDVVGGFTGYMPISAYDRRTDDELGFGMQLGGYYALNPSNPVLLGFTFDFGFMSARSTNYDELDGDGNIFEVKETLTNIIMRPALRLKYPMLTWKGITPFVEGHLGANWLISWTTVYDEDLDEQIDSFHESSDIALCYGAGFGAEVNINPFIALFGRVEYSVGNSMTHMALNDDIDKDDVMFPFELYDKVESSTDMLIFAVGIIGRL